MKIGMFILHADPTRGGAERYTIDLSRSLIERGHEVSLIATTFARDVGLARHVRLNAISRSRLGVYLKALDALDDHLLGNHYDIVHAMLPVRRCHLYHPHAGLAADAATVEQSLESFSTRALALNLTEAYGVVPKKPGVAYFFSRPSSGGACKRLNLFLRWMVRIDRVDLGLWSRVRPAQLIVPLDTHVIRVGRCLGLTRLATPGWRMAADITRALRALDPRDPVKYDFSLCHLGMMSACGFATKQKDSRCPLKGCCRPAVRA